MSNQIILGSLLALQLASFYFITQQDSVIKSQTEEKDIIAIAYLDDLKSGIKGSVYFDNIEMSMSNEGNVSD